MFFVLFTGTRDLIQKKYQGWRVLWNSIGLLLVAIILLGLLWAIYIWIFQMNTGRFILGLIVWVGFMGLLLIIRVGIRSLKNRKKARS